MRFRPTIVVPAAGRGARFDGTLNKLEQPFADGTVLGTTLRHAVQSQLPVVLVTTARLQPLAASMLAARDIIVLSAHDARRGMGHTIATGISERSGAPGWLVLPGDMPLITSATILAVATGLEQQAIAFAQHRGRHGHPVGFSAELYSELILLSGDEGARRLMARYPARAVAVDDPGVLQDIDTVADLEALRAQASAG